MLKTALHIIGFLVLLDIFLVIMSIMAIAVGDTVYHTPFFDPQIKLLAKLLI